MSAPERIWLLWPEVLPKGRYASSAMDHSEEGFPAYTRTDLYAAAQAEIARLREELATARDRALDEAAALVEGSVYTSNGGERELQPANPKMRGMDMHHGTIAAAIRALKGAKP